MPTDAKTLPPKSLFYLADHGWVHVTRDHPRAAPPVGIFDPPVACCIELNQLWSSHVIGALGALMQRDSWSGDDAEQFRAVQEVEKFINRCLQPCEEDCGVFLLRQNPANKCQLQQSVDGGSSWTLAFDFGLCRNDTGDMIYVQNVNNIYNTLITNLTNQYDGTPESIAPETVYDSDPDETDLRDRALCYAVNRAVTIICEMMIAGIAERESKGVLYALAIAAGVALFIGYSILTGGLGAIAAFGAWASGGVALAGAASALVNWASEAIGSHDKAPFQDMEARADVACCWYNALKGATVTETVFADSLTGCTFSGNAQVIRDVIHDSNQIQAEYLQFTQLFKQSIAAERVGILPDCPCATCAMELFNYSNPGDWALVAGSHATLDPTGFYTSGALDGQGNPQWILMTNAGDWPGVTAIKAFVDISANASLNDGLQVTYDGSDHTFQPMPFVDTGGTRVYTADLVTPEDVTAIILNLNSAVNTPFRLLKIEFCP